MKLSLQHCKIIAVKNTMIIGICLIPTKAPVILLPVAMVSLFRTLIALSVYMF